MPALNFKKQFVPLIESGKKRQTIRKYRKDGRDPKPEDTLYLYTGQRTKHCRKLKEVLCTETFEIEIGGAGCYYFLQVGYAVIPPYEQDEFAQADGFRDMEELGEWIERDHGLPFRGLLILW